jgi:SET domain-containing protein
MTAVVDIEKGQELFFDYGPLYTPAITWGQGD